MYITEDPNPKKINNTYGKQVILGCFPAYQGPEIAQRNKSQKQCKFTGCTNTFIGIVNQDYCRDPRCVALRNEAFSHKKREIVRDPDAKNIILAGPKYKKKLHKGQALKIRCRAKSGLNIRCPNKFYITYDPKQNTYPCFCEDHRSAYKRQVYLQKGSSV